MFALPSVLSFLGLLAVPLVVHLFSRSRPRRITVSSLRFIESSQSLQSRSLRITDWPLLLLRIGIIAMAVAGAARPFLSLPRDPGRFALVAEELSGDPRVIEDVDSLRELGYTVRSMAALGSFRELTSRLVRSDSAIPPGSEVVVMADARLGRVGRGAVGLASSYHILDRGPDRSTWLEEPAGDSSNIVADRVISRAGSTFRERGPISPDSISIPAAEPVRVHIAIGESEAPPASTVRAAFRAVEQVTGRRIIFSDSAPDIAVIGAGVQDVQATRAVVVEPGGEGDAVDDEFDPTGIGFSGVRISRYQRPVGTPVQWSRDGRPVVSVSRSSNGTSVYRLGTRFDPAWSELLTHESLPAFLYAVLRERPDAVAEAHLVDERDNRSVPFLAEIGPTANARTRHLTSLARPLIVGAIMLFLLERFIVRRRSA